MLLSRFVRPTHLRETVARAILNCLVSATRVIPLIALAPLAHGLATVANRMRGIGIGATSVNEEVAAAIRFLPPRDAVILDVGANKGDWTRSMLSHAAERVGRIFMFEPSETHREALASLDAGRCTLVPMAVGAKCGQATLYADTPGSGLGSLHKRRLNHLGLHHDAQQSVTVTTLDAFVLAKSIEHVDFLKMDIEGQELEALRGARQILAERRIRAASFEFGGSNIDSRTYFQDFWYELSPLGFRIYRILTGGRLLPITAYTEDLEAFVTTNYLAVLADTLGSLCP